jgi:hypothetical protein
VDLDALASRRPAQRFEGLLRRNSVTLGQNPFRLLDQNP